MKYPCQNIAWIKIYKWCGWSRLTKLSFLYQQETASKFFTLCCSYANNTGPDLLWGRGGQLHGCVSASGDDVRSGYVWLTSWEVTSWRWPSHWLSFCWCFQVNYVCWPKLQINVFIQLVKNYFSCSGSLTSEPEFCQYGQARWEFPSGSGQPLTVVREFADLTARIPDPSPCSQCSLSVSFSFLSISDPSWYDATPLSSQVISNTHMIWQMTGQNSKIPIFKTPIAQPPMSYK